MKISFLSFFTTHIIKTCIVFDSMQILQYSRIHCCVQDILSYTTHTHTHLFIKLERNQPHKIFFIWRGLTNTTVNNTYIQLSISYSLTYKNKIVYKIYTDICWLPHQMYVHLSRIFYWSRSIRLKISQWWWNICINFEIKYILHRRNINSDYIITSN